MNIKQLPQDPDLTRLLEIAKTIKMTSGDEFEQRVSWVYGMLGENSKLSKDAIRERMVMHDYAQQEIDSLRAQLAECQRELDALRGEFVWPMLERHQSCGCVICICEDDHRCSGCGAKHCGTHVPGTLPPNPIYKSHPLKGG